LPWFFAVACAFLAVAPVLSQPPPLRIMPLGDSITYGSNNDGVGGGYATRSMWR
jgi:hypothetical protein